MTELLWATSWLLYHLTQPLNSPANASSDLQLLPPIELRAPKFQRKAMPSITRGSTRDRAGTAPHTAPHTTSFRPPAHSDLLWKHRDSHTSLLSNCHVTPRLPRSLLSNLHIIPRLPRDWAIQLWATSWLLYHWTELLWATSWLLYHLTKLSLWATSWLLYHLTKLSLWATSWLLYHLTTLSNCS